MPVGKKKSPAKFMGALALGLGVVQGATQIVGGLMGRGARKDEEIAAQNEFDANKKAYQNLDTSNLYAGVKNQFSGLQNTFEDLTVNQQQAQFEAQQNAQNQANILQNLRGAAGGSGIAGLAQAMAGQSQLATQRASASIGMQEARNQQMSAQGAANIQLQERQGEQYAESMRLQGATQARSAEAAKTENLLSMSAGRLDAAKQARADAKQNIIGGIGSILGAGASAAMGGVFGGKTALPAGKVEGVDLFKAASENARKTQSIINENKINVPLNTIKRK